MSGKSLRWLLKTRPSGGGCQWSDRTPATTVAEPSGRPPYSDGVEGPGAHGPAELVLIASVARRYYLQRQSKVEIAEALGISRFKVARLLDAADETGVVRIEIGWPGQIDVELSDELQQELGLTHCIVVDVPHDDGEPAALRKALGVAAAELLEEIVTGEDVLGLAWARSVSAMCSHLTRLPGTPVVQLTGALHRDDSEDSSIELVRGAAQLSGGPSYLFFAPLVVPDAATAKALRSDPDVSRAFARFGSVTKAVAGIGGWAPGQSTVFDAASGLDQRRLRRLGVVADVSGVFVGADGGVLSTELTERIVGISAEAMRAIPEVIGIAYGRGKATAVQASVRSGLVDSLVTHASLARLLLGRR